MASRCATLIFATEPVFAALFGYLLASERLTKGGLVGCGLILLGMLLAELRPGISQRPSSDPYKGEKR